MSEIRTLLTRAAEELPAAPVPEDLWRKGRRLRRRGRLAAAVAVLVVLLLVGVPWLMLRPGHTGPATEGAAVPAELYVPWTWQATVQQSPRGSASVLFSGDGGLRGTDLIDHEGKVAVVGRDGSYRMLLYGGAETVAGEQVLLSPNGRYVAQEGGFETDRAVEVVDLRTGKTRGYSGVVPGGFGRPVAWSPDGRKLLILESPPVESTAWTTYGEPIVPGSLVVIDLDTPTVTRLASVPDVSGLRTASLAAFSPDSKHVAVNANGKLTLYDSHGATEWTTTLGPRRYLAGIGAFTDDGTRITVTTLHGCLDNCDDRKLGARTWSFGYVAAATGKPADGPSLAPVRAMAVRALGWRHGADLVVVAHRPEPGVTSGGGDWNDTDYWSIGDARLLALPSGGGRAELLIDAPDDVLAIDVARDLLEAGRFGGPSPRPEALPPRWDSVAWYAGCLLCVLLFVAFVGLLVWVASPRRRTTPPGHGTPPGHATAAGGGPGEVSRRS
jgi:hypothetical protein